VGEMRTADLFYNAGKHCEDVTADWPEMWQVKVSGFWINTLASSLSL
jgi:hypothetical protein